PFFNTLILKNKKYLAREDNPLTRITRTVLYIYIYEKLHSGGGIGIPTTHCLWDRPPRQILTPAKLKKCVALVGMMPIW
ncbi:TPA: hypothetical protein ACHGF8_003705, partial [Escherichia coli]